VPPQTRTEGSDCGKDKTRDEKQPPVPLALDKLTDPVTRREDCDHNEERPAFSPIQEPVWFHGGTTLFTRLFRSGSSRRPLIALAIFPPPTPDGSMYIS
jgi:hypothetical protein